MKFKVGDRVKFLAMSAKFEDGPGYLYCIVLEYNPGLYGGVGEYKVNTGHWISEQGLTRVTELEYLVFSEVGNEI